MYSTYTFDHNIHLPNFCFEFGFYPWKKGCILGEEMGLGKTVICIALIVSNPSPLANRILPREYIWELEKHEVNHEKVSRVKWKYVTKLCLSIIFNVSFFK